MEEYKSLYRKWRPKVFDEVIGQEHITSILKSQVMTGKIPHSYLFSGMRGTGKTTCARILAKAVNCESPDDGNPCGMCPSCAGIGKGNIIDIIEIDAASNNRVDDMRAMIDEIFYMPSELKKKVYIIDEVHMLSLSAVNAFLKTLEEPPEHVIFVLATTEFQKIPATIISRCQRFDFKRIQMDEVKKSLRSISDSEKIIINDDALELIAKLSGGAMRDALSLLEMCKGVEKALSLTEVKKLFGVGDRDKLLDIFYNVVTGNSGGALNIFWDMYENSKDIKNFCGDLLEVLRDIQVAKISMNPQEHIVATSEEIKKITGIEKITPKENVLYYNRVIIDTISDLYKYNLDKKIVIEMMLITLCEYDGNSADGTDMQPSPVITARSYLNADSPAGGAGGRHTDIKLADLIEECAKINKVVATTFLRSSKCKTDGNTLIIYQKNDFVKKQLEKPESMQAITDAAKKLTKTDYKVKIESLADNEQKNEAKGSIDELMSKF